MSCNKSIPCELSDLLVLAVNDAKICDLDPRYRLHMDYWHIPASNLGGYFRRNNALDIDTDGDECVVCMAGSVLAQQCEVSPTAEARPGFTDIGDEMNAINEMRIGDFRSAAVNMDIKLPTEVALEARGVMGKQNVKLMRYSWAGYLRAAKVLRENGY